MLEHPPQFNITQSELAPVVADYFDNLLAQRDAILARYQLTPETAGQFCDIHTSDEDRETILALYERIVYVIENKQIPPNPDKLEKFRMAQEIMKEEFFGIEAIEKTFGIHLDITRIPDIPFSLEALDRAEELGQFLILRVDKTDDEVPLTMKQMESMLADVWEQEQYGSIFESDPLCRNEEYIVKETPRLSWALVSKDIIPHSTNKNYLEQTDLLINYLTHTVFIGAVIPEPWQSAIDEFEQKKDAIQAILESNWKEAAQQLEALKINLFSRHTPVEVLYDLLVYFLNTKEKERLWEEVWTWTSRRASGGGLVSVGGFDSGGAYVGSRRPFYASGDRGVTFSRRH